MNKFLFTVDRDAELVERYRAEPLALVRWWETERSNQLINSVAAEASTWLCFEDVEREALGKHDHVALFGLGAHPFLVLTLWIAMFERDFSEPLGFQHEFAARLSHFSHPYPDIAT